MCSSSSAACAAAPVDPVLLQDVADAAIGGVPEIGQGALDAIIAPGRILLGETDHQVLDALRDRWTAGLVLSAVTVVPLLRNEGTVPTQDGVRREERADLCQELATEDFSFDSQASTLVVVQQDAAFAEFLLEDLVLGAEIVNDLLLLLVDPAREDGEQQLPRLQDEVCPSGNPA
jgi:hypothetical protein